MRRLWGKWASRPAENRGRGRERWSGHRGQIGADAPLIRRALQVALWGAVVIGALGGLLAVARHDAAPSRPRPAPSSSPAAAARVDGFAELFVAAYLGAGSETQASLAPFFDGSVDLSQVSDGSQYVARTAVAGEAQVSPGYWSVTVAAEVLEQKDGRYGAGTLRYFQVGVFVDEHGNPAATALPAEVPAPARGTAPSLAQPDLAPPDPSDPLQTTAQQFLAALLCGQGDISRVESPDVSIPAIDPAPLKSVELTGVAEATSGGSSRFTALVSGTTTAGNNVVLEYQLDLRERAGRWEVAALSGAPNLANAPSGTSQRRSPAGSSVPRGQSLAPPNTVSRSSAASGSSTSAAGPAS